MVDAYAADTAHVLAVLDLGDFYDVGGAWDGDPVAANLSADVSGTSKVFALHVIQGEYAVGDQYTGDLSDAIDSDTLAAMSTDSTAGNETRGMHVVSISAGTLTVPTRYLALVAVPVTFSAAWYSDGGSLLVGSVDGDIIEEPEVPDGEPTPDPDPDPPALAGGAILEIYAGDPDGARWDVAEWDEADWSASAWVDITPQGIIAKIRWGVRRPELGILGQSEAATWAVDTYDPDRILDPANADSPYHGDLIPTLPIRLRHDETVIRQGTVESLGYSFRSIGGYIRASDNLAVMANAKIPDDVELADTLRARARDAIAAAGLSVIVEADPADGDPAIAARVPAAASVWEVIASAAQDALNVAWIDPQNRLRFRPYAEPLYRGRSVTAADLVDLSTVVDGTGRYSRVIVQPEDPEADPIERAVTPTPIYGAKTFTRDDPTLDPEAWAAAVLADRAGVTRRWVPGDVYAPTAAAVQLFATMEAAELVALLHAYTSPAVDVGAIILGGEITVIGKKDSAAVWTFELYTAEAPPIALVDSETGSIFVVASDISDTPGALLYPSGDGALGGGGGSGGTGAPPPDPTPPGGGGSSPPPVTGVIRTVGPTTSRSEINAIAHDLAVDIIEMTSGAYPIQDWDIAVDRGSEAHRLTIRPAPGAVVRWVGPATTTGIVIRMGDASLCAFVTLDGRPGGLGGTSAWIFDGIDLAQSGVIEPRGTEDCAIRFLTFRNLTRDDAWSDEPYKSWAFYISGEGDTGSNKRLVIEDIFLEEPTVAHDVSAIQVASSGSHEDITMRRIHMTGYNYGLSVDVPVDGLTIDDWDMDDVGDFGASGRTAASIRIFPVTVNGTYSNITATDSEALVDAGTGTFTDGGGNSGI